MRMMSCALMARCKAGCAGGVPEEETRAGSTDYAGFYRAPNEHAKHVAESKAGTRTPHGVGHCSRTRP